MRLQQRLSLVREAAAPSSGFLAALQHVSTLASPLSIPVPLALLRSHCEMAVDADGKGYDLLVELRLGNLRCVTYSGRLRELAATDDVDGGAATAQRLVQRGLLTRSEASAITAHDAKHAYPENA